MKKKKKGKNKMRVQANVDFKINGMEASGIFIFEDAHAEYFLKSENKEDLIGGILISSVEVDKVEYMEIEDEA